MRKNYKIEEPIWQKEERTLKIISIIISLLLAFPLIYSAIVAMHDYDLALQEMNNQIFPEVIAFHLTWLNTAIQLLIAGFLVVVIWAKSYEGYACISTLVLYALYTAYTQAVWMLAFGSRPCACIYFLNVGWSGALIWNLVLLFLSVILCLLYIKKRRVVTTSTNLA